MSATLDLLLLATSWTHVLLAPYTKVEESFNLHATHDVLMYGVGSDVLDKYDHFVFPGAVPRTFIGSVLLAWISMPVLRVCRELGVLTDKAEMQVIVRLVLATCNAIGFALLRRGVSRRYGGPAGVLFVLLTCTQFHLPFWMGRTLPNMFALLPVNVALYKLWDRAPNATRPNTRDIDIAVMLLAFTGVVFRGEVALLLGPVVLHALWSGHTSISRVFKVGLLSSLATIALTVVVDSYFWQKWPLWPELYGIYFNVVRGKSAEWGVSPFYTYLWPLSPKMLGGAIPPAAIGIMMDGRIRSLLLPHFVFVGLLSLLGHKEWRFIVYVVPAFNIAAARGGSWLISRRKSSWSGRIALVFMAGCLAFNVLLTYVGIMSSINNYPGGEALRQFNEMHATENHVHVHISNLAAQTGASLFLQTYAPPYPEGLGLEPSRGFTPWVYNKTEDVTPTQLTADRHITHAIAEIEPGNVRAFDGTKFPGKWWKLTAIVTGFDRVILDLPALKADFMRPWEVLKFAKSEQLAILEKR